MSDIYEELIKQENEYLDNTEQGNELGNEFLLPEEVKNTFYHCKNNERQPIGYKELMKWRVK